VIRSDPALLAQLNATAEGYCDPLAKVEWTLLSLEDWWLPPALVSLAGLPEFEALPESTRKRLSQYEFLHFLHAGLWLERLFMERLAGALRRTASPLEYAAHLHEIREEAGHSLMFLKLMEQSGLYLPARAFRVPHLADFVGRHAPTGSALFWLAVTMGEELSDKFNRGVRSAAEINPVVTRICTLHMIDEARHIARARNVLDPDLRRLGPLRRALLAPLASTLLRQFARALFLPRAELYELAGLAPGSQWHRAARRNAPRAEFMRQCAEPTLARLQAYGIRIELPHL
jgi:hypothetical protein